ncbi:hypothetical protein [Mycolicibacterium lutetiense]
MTYPGQFRGWDPFRPLETVSALWSSATAIPVTGGAAAYRTLFTTLRRLVVGRRLTVRLDIGEIALTVTEFESGLDMRSLSVGQLNDVSLSATAITWNGQHFNHASVVMHNVHLRPDAPPVLVAAPVEVTVQVPAAAVEDLLHTAVPRLTGRVGADGVARLHMTCRPRLGHLEVDADIEGSTLSLTPRALSLRRRRWMLPTRIPAYRVHLPPLPLGLELTGVHLGPEVVEVSGRLPEWRIEVPLGRLEDVINQLSGVGRYLNLTRFKPPSQ